MTAAEEAQQLDSVTDLVQEREIDASKAKNAMSALLSSHTVDPLHESGLGKKKIEVSKEDIALIVFELEVSDDIAEKTLREVMLEGSITDREVVLEAALRKLVFS